MGIEVVDGAAGHLSLEVRPYLHNSFGAVQGGVIGMLAEAAGAEALGAARGADGSDVVVTDLQIAYLALGRVGPVVTSARVLEPGADGRCSAVVELRDRGAGDRLMTVANVVAVPTRAVGRVATVSTAGRGRRRPDRRTDRRRHVSDYFRLERWEVPAEGEQPPVVRAAPRSTTTPRGPGGGLRTGGLLTNLDSLGGFTSGLAVLPRWIVTTSLLATVSELRHVGPLGFRVDVVRRGRSSVVTTLDVVDEGAEGRHVAAATMTCAVLDPGAMVLEFERPVVVPMPGPQLDPVGPVEFFSIEPGGGPTTRLLLDDRLRNPWGILHGGAVAMLADEAACRAAADVPGAAGPGGVAAADVVLHYLRPVKVGPVEARCSVLGTTAGRTVVRVAIHDVGSGDRMTNLGTVSVLAV